MCCTSFFKIIHDYTFNGRNQSGCPTFLASRVETVPYSVCYTANRTIGSFTRIPISTEPALLERARVSRCAGVPQFVETIEVSDAASVIMMVVASLVILAAVIVLVTMFIFRRTPVVRAANQAFVYVHLLGVIMGVATVFPFAVKPNDASCAVIPIIGGLGFVLAVGAMLAKMIRIQRILSNTSLVSIPISTKVWKQKDHHLFIHIFLLVDFVFYILILIFLLFF